MQTNPIFQEAGREGELARALNVALHALVMHTGMHANSEGEAIQLNFTGEIETVRRAAASHHATVAQEAVPSARGSRSAPR